MKYFELLDDVTVPNRLHIGEVRAADGTEPRLRAGIRLDCNGNLAATITRPGRILDFCLTSFAVPLASSRLASGIGDVAGHDLQGVPVVISENVRMVALNALRVVRCVDEAKSEFVKWTRQDHRADLAGQYRQVTKLTLDKNIIPRDAHLFRVEGWLVALIVSELVKVAMERAGCLGAKFIDATSFE